ncbi:MAG: hypothetical protein HY738_15450 [Bacteroidia bacterium]|nr:hypothetical protein [Bacteroidia bacterium]
MKNNTTNLGFLEFIYDFYKTMKCDEICLVYEGEITHQVIKAFTSIIESNMNKADEPNPVQRKVFHVMVECLQNISKHAESVHISDKVVEGKGIYLVNKDNDSYHVLSGNIISNNKIPNLKDFITNINNRDREELKEMYKKQIKEGRLSDKGGAGLGFIDIVRKTGKALESHFFPIDKNFSFFVLIVTIPRNL